MGFISPEDWKPVDIEFLEPNAWNALKEQSSTSVIAGPGAGKTEFLAQKATYLLQTGICPPPKKILAISFKKDAAKNLAERVQKRCPKEQSCRFISQTFDAFTKTMLDRFLPALPKELRPDKNYEITFNNLGGIDINFLSQNKIPISNIKPTTESQIKLLKWWKSKIKNSEDKSALNFIMINRLVELLLRHNNQVLKALRLTYPIVFVDEFQDTTYAQYDLLKTAFLSSSIVTSVGDNKQRIMLWAGARPDAFNTFEQEFKAKRIDLQMNFRSSKELVKLHYVIARSLDQQAKNAIGNFDSSINGETAQIWSFPDERTEAEYISSFICNDINERNTKASDYAILVKQNADQYMNYLKNAFKENDISLLNISKEIKIENVKVHIQDLLTENLTKILLALLRVFSEKKSPDNWINLKDFLLLINGIDSENKIKVQQLENEIKTFIKNTRNTFESINPTEESTQRLIDVCLNFLDLNKIRQAFPEYNQGDWLETVTKAFYCHFKDCSSSSSSWIKCLDEFEGLNHVSLLTIHKSKGLEYDTVFLIGLDDSSWWSYSRNKAEGKSTFFVALSRAKERIIFTYCQSKSISNKVSELYGLLSNAGVTEETIKQNKGSIK